MIKLFIEEDNLCKKYTLFSSTVMNTDLITIVSFQLSSMSSALTTTCLFPK